MSLQRVGDLEINEDLEFEHRSWQVQRVAWAILSLIVLVALLGLLGGGGPFSVARVGMGSPLEVSYARFARHNNAVEMAVRLQPGAVPGDEARVWVNSTYLERTTSWRRAARASASSAWTRSSTRCWSAAAASPSSPAT
jgi:hypothetical protein